MRINRDFARIALSVYRVAQLRDDMDEVEAMAAAIESYQHQENREADERASADRRRFLRPAQRPRILLTPAQVLAIQKALRRPSLRHS